MTVGDLIFYVLDILILVLLVRMYRNSKTIEIKTSLGPRWVIPAVFWAIALLGLFNYTGAFRWIQTILLAIMGGLYWMMDSGLSRKGMVMIGRLYPYEKIKPITIDDEDHCVNFTIRRASTPIYFMPEQMKEVRSYLSKYAGLPKRNVRTKTKSSAAVRETKPSAEPAHETKAGE